MLWRWAFELVFACLCWRLTIPPASRNTQLDQRNKDLEAFGRPVWCDVAPEDRRKISQAVVTGKQVVHDWNWCDESIWATALITDITTSLKAWRWPYVFFFFQNVAALNKVGVSCKTRSPSQVRRTLGNEAPDKHQYQIQLNEMWAIRPLYLVLNKSRCSINNNRYYR